MVAEDKPINLMLPELFWQLKSELVRLLEGLIFEKKINSNMRER